MSDAMRTENYDENRRYTYADYLKWEGPERYQLINGEVFQMASLSVNHQAIFGELFNQFYNWLKGKPCRVFASPLDVRLFPKKDKSDNTVVQPDILVVCDKNKIAKNSINGSPDLVVEVVSPSNTHSELFLKFQYYLKAGVREYWIVDPEGKKVYVHLYEDDGYYISTIYEDKGAIPVTILPGFEIAFESIFEQMSSS